MAPLKTKGFMNARQRNRHFNEHGADFGASNAREYEDAADRFLGGTLSVGMHECTRKQGDKIRFDPRSQEFGVIDSGGIIRTYYKPIPCAEVPAAIREAVRLAGRCHRYANNYLYFLAECKKTW
jgi:pyocin large subunit-like protein